MKPGNWWERNVLGDKRYKGQSPRELSQQDVASFFESAQRTPPPVRTVANLRLLMYRRNPVRWARIQSDFRWMQREMKRIGLNPEDARWLP